jgi:hypothetical protein
VFGSALTARAGIGLGIAAPWRRALAFLRALAARRHPAPPPAPPRRLRPVLVPGSLAELKGPKSGVVELPITLYWSGRDPKFNLDDHYEAIRMYLAVLDAARSVDDLATYLNGDLLAELWPELRLARAKRGPWEDRFGELRPAATAA